MAAPWRDHGMDLDQLTTPIQLDRVGIDAGVQPPTHQLAGDAVERLAHLHVPIRGHLRVGPGRDVKHLIGYRLELGKLLGGEHLGRVQPGRAVHPHPRHRRAPLLSTRPTIIDVPEVFSGKEIRPHIGNTALDARLVPRHQLRSIPSVISELFG